MERTRFEHADPILYVSDMTASVDYYINRLGFRRADWSTPDFGALQRDGATIYLCQRAQGHPGTWIWVGVEDAAALYQEYQTSGARVRHAPRNYPWALEFHLEDPDGNVLRCGSEPLPDRPFDSFQE